MPDPIVAPTIAAITFVIKAIKFGVDVYQHFRNADEVNRAIGRELEAFGHALQTVQNDYPAWERCLRRSDIAASSAVTVGRKTLDILDMPKVLEGCFIASFRAVKFFGKDVKWDAERELAAARDDGWDVQKCKEMLWKLWANTKSYFSRDSAARVLLNLDRAKATLTLTIGIISVKISAEQTQVLKDSLSQAREVMARKGSDASTSAHDKDPLALLQQTTRTAIFMLSSAGPGQTLREPASSDSRGSQSTVVQETGADAPAFIQVQGAGFVVYIQPEKKNLVSALHKQISQALRIATPQRSSDTAPPALAHSQTTMRRCLQMFEQEETAVVLLVAFGENQAPETFGSVLQDHLKLPASERESMFALECHFFASGKQLGDRWLILLLSDAFGTERRERYATEIWARSVGVNWSFYPPCS